MKQILRCLKITSIRYPVQAICFLLLSFPSMILPTVIVWQENLLVNAIQFSNSLKIILLHLLLIFLAYLFLYVFDVSAKYYMEFGYFQKVILGLDKLVQNKIGRIDLEILENSETYEVLEQGRFASDAVIFSASLFNIILQTGFTLFFLTSYLTTLNSKLFIFVIFISVSAILKEYYNARTNSKVIQEGAHAKQKMLYFGELFYNLPTAKEMKVFGSRNIFLENWKSAFFEKNALEGKRYQKNFVISSFYYCVMSVCHVLAFLLLISLFVKSELNLGEFTVTLSCFVTIAMQVRSLFTSSGDIMKVSGVSKNFFKLLDLPESDRSKPNTTIKNLETIEFRNVSYTYPGAEKPAVKNISFILEAGKNLALVGINGSGKSTLVKLMCGFLDPTEGEIFFNQIPQKQLKKQEILSHISAVYQNYGKYKFSLLENITISDPKRKVQFDDIEALSKKFDICLPVTQKLGMEFGGIDLSGGQWQRLAAVRCFYRERTVVFLDEPTAAIDPIEEAKFFQFFSEMSSNKTTVLISHRLGAVRKADILFVLEDGSLIERGSFQELLNQNAYFADLWNSQASWYTDSMEESQEYAEYKVK